jgi:hypothetical protein
MPAETVNSPRKMPLLPPEAAQISALAGRFGQIPRFPNAATAIKGKA